MSQTTQPPVTGIDANTAALENVFTVEPRLVGCDLLVGGFELLAQRRVALCSRLRVGGDLLDSSHASTVSSWWHGQRGAPKSSSIF